VPTFNDPDTIARILTGHKTWAVVGCSPRPTRDSHRVAAFLQELGHHVVPVNPAAEGTILGEPVRAALAHIGEPIDVVDVFRRSSAAGTAVDDAITVGAAAVWLQLGVIDRAAADRALAAGLDVIMDRCPKIEYPAVVARSEERPPDASRA